MLSRKDIEKELGKDLGFYPLRPSNIKENSINMTISQYAWCQSDATIYWYGDLQFSVHNDLGKIEETLHYKKGSKCIFTDYHKNTQYLLLFPNQTTILETEEVIAIGNSIGGAVHSKVGVVAQGIGDTGTMLGPGYCGHLMISLHNITNDVVTLNVGTTFVSLTFDYLNTKVIRTSATVSSHYDRLLEHGCKLDAEEKEYFVEDWKTSFSGICEKMCESEEYKKYRKSIQQNSLKELRQYVNKKNIISLIIVGLVFGGLYYGAYRMDQTLSSPVWVDRFWNVGCSGFIGSLLIGIWRSLKGKK